MARLTAADVDYIRTNYLTLYELCAGRSERPRDVEALIAARRLPGPAYILDDGTAMFPSDYFRLVDDAGGADALREHFVGRHRAAARRQRAAWQESERDWESYLDGAYGVCLREVTPENIVRKTALVSSLCELLMLPRPRAGHWRQQLREQVDELDALEREFSPDYDRSEEHDRMPTRELLIDAARARYPDVFARHATEDVG